MSVKRSLGWTTIGQIILFVCQIGSQIIVSRHLSPYLVGISTIAFSISDFVNLMQTFGLRNFLIREHELSPALVRTTYTVNMVMSLTTAALVVGLALGGAVIYHEPRVAHVLYAIALIPLVMSFELVPGAVLQRNMQFGALALCNSMKALLTAGTTIAMVFADASYMSISYGALAGAVASALLTNIMGRRFMSWGFSLEEWRKVTKFGLHMLGISGASNFSAKAADLVIGRTLGLGDLGLYSRGSTLNGLLWTNIHSVFTRVVFSAMAEEKRKTGSIRQVYLQTVDMVTATLWPAFAGMAILAGPFVHLMYGEKWVGAAPVLSLFSLGSIGATAITMTWEVFVLCERTGQQTKLEMIRGLVTLATTSIGSFFGLYPAAGGRIMDAIVSIGLYRAPLSELTETSFAEVSVIYRRNALLTLIAVAPALAVMLAYGWRSDAPLLLVLPSIAASVVCWLAAAHFLHPSLREEVMSVVRKRRGGAQS